jgi:quercetin 2,3-dioxygenase
MIKIRRSNERGHANHGWLDTYHTFSFADYFDPAFMNFRALRVINEDFVAPGMGFPTHGHKDMEIITVILEGSLEHKDSMGTGSVIRPGDVQRMTAGSGVTHSEFNHSKTESVHLLQIWILPDKTNLAPSYEQKHYSEHERYGWCCVAHPNLKAAVKVHQDAELYITIMTKGKKQNYSLRPGRHAWIQVARGELALNGQELKQGDGAAISDEKKLEFEARIESEILLFDLA